MLLHSCAGRGIMLMWWDFWIYSNNPWMSMLLCRSDYNVKNVIVFIIQCLHCGSQLFYIPCMTHMHYCYTINHDSNISTMTPKSKINLSQVMQFSCFIDFKIWVLENENERYYLIKLTNRYMITQCSLSFDIPYPGGRLIYQYGSKTNIIEK